MCECVSVCVCVCVCVSVCIVCACVHVCEKDETQHYGSSFERERRGYVMPFTSL